MTAPLQTILGPTEPAPGRCFADPGYIGADRTTMVTGLQHFARTLHAHRGSSGPVVEHYPEAPGWQRRTLITDPTVFTGLDIVTVVGFFGQRNRGATPEICAQIEELSETLFERIPEVEGVYAYVTQLLVDEYNYVNLVLVDNADVISRWRQTDPHPMAAAVVSPGYYDSVRIYNGAVPVVAMTDPRALDLHCVKYWDFRETPPWSAVREFRRGAGRVA